MARPIKQFTEIEAQAHLMRLYKASKEDSFGKNIKGENPYGKDLDLAQSEIRSLLVNSTSAKSTLPADLQAWISKHLTVEGWARIRAAARQNRAHVKSGGMITKIDRSSSHYFTYLAEAAGVTKKEYMERLSVWLMLDENGQLAAASFLESINKSKIGQ